MRKTITAIAIAATVALASVAAPQPAQARHGRIAAGIIGGLAVGALLGAAAANGPHYGYGPGYYDGPPRRYYYRRYYRPHCWWEHERYWNGWRWRWHRERVCN
jgi:hypothetical protein